jgi:alpha-galactosidase
MKVAIIGAGSLEFASRLTADILSFPALRSTEFALVDVDAERLGYAQRITDDILRRGGYPDARYSAHTDRRDALAGADAVIVSILVGGYAAIEREIDIPLRYGVDQAIGDTLTPGGIMRCLRTLPELIAIGRDVMDLCPDAWVLNYTNPMAMLCWGLERAVPGIRLVGLCHSVQHTTQSWARRLEVPYSEVGYDCAGINHQAWITEFTHRGVDQLPAIRALAERDDIWRRDSSRMEYVKHFGFPVTEMSGHNSEYSPWFRKSPETVARYCPGGGWNGGSGFIKTLYNRPDWRATMERMASGEQPVSLGRSDEYGAAIVNALAGGGPVRIYGNVTNRGMGAGLLIDNLPADACVEVACDVDAGGLQPRRFGPLPSHLAAINGNQINVQRLAVEATLAADPERVFQAMALDPLTGAVCTLDQIRAMTRELLQAHAEFLPAFSGRELRAAPVLAERAAPNGG